MEQSHPSDRADADPRADETPFPILAHMASQCDREGVPRTFRRWKKAIQDAREAGRVDSATAEGVEKTFDLALAALTGWREIAASRPRTPPGRGQST